MDHMLMHILGERWGNAGGTDEDARTLIELLEKAAIPESVTEGRSRAILTLSFEDVTPSTDEPHDFKNCGLKKPRRGPYDDEPRGASRSFGPTRNLAH